jgi:ketosteroid isomerase-like protein
MTQRVASAFPAIIRRRPAGRMWKRRKESPMDRKEMVRSSYRAYETGDRELLEGLVAEDFRFWSPPDPGIDRAAYWERCWPNHGHVAAFEFKRLYEVADEVVVTYEAERTDGSRFRNTEVFGFDGDKIKTVEVYFGWDL